MRKTSKRMLARSVYECLEALEVRMLLSETAFNATQTPWAISATAISWVESENYDNGGEGVAYHDTTAANQGGAYRTDGVDIEGPNTATDGTYNIGYVSNGEWLQYTINVAAAGSYQLNLRSSSAGTGGSASVSFGGVNATGTMTIAGTGGWQTYENVDATVNLTAGVQIMRVNVIVGNFNMDYISLQPTRTVSNPEQAYGVRGLPPLLPTWGTAQVEAENYDLGGQGYGYFKNNTTENIHGTYNNAPFRATDYVATTNVQYSGTDLMVSNWDAGDWTQYTIDAAVAGTYEILLNYDNGSNTPAVMNIGVNGTTQVSNLAFAGTGSWTAAGNEGVVPAVVTLVAGQNVLRVTDVSGTFNLDSMAIAQSTTFGNAGYSWHLPAVAAVTIPAEDFDVNPGAYLDTTPGNSGNSNFRPGTDVDIETTSDTGGGSDVTAIAPTEYLDYTVRPDLEGRYYLNVRVASATGGTFQISFAGTNRTGTVTVPATGGVQVWETLNLSVVFLAGIQTMQLQALSGTFNLNWIQLQKDTTTPAVLADPTELGSYAAEPPDAALAAASDVFNVAFDQQYDWINKPANSPVPTNDWWTQILTSTFANSLWTYPGKLSDSANGIAVTGYSGVTATAGNIGVTGGQTFTISGTTGTFTEDALLDYGDWSVHYRMLQAGAGYIDVTMAEGSPFSWYEFNGLTPKVTLNSAWKLYNGGGTTALTASATAFTTDQIHIDPSGNGTGPQFAIFAPAGTTFVWNGGVLTATSNPGYLVAAQLPDNTAATMALFYQQAYAIPRGSTYNWTYSANGGTVSTTWNINLQALKAGAPLTTIQGWLPHNYVGTVSGPTMLSGYAYQTINGSLLLSVGSAFTIVQPGQTLAFELPTPAEIGGSADYNSAQMEYYLQTFAAQNASVPIYGNDTYFGGKDPQMYAEFALMAQQLNDPTYTTFLNALQTTLTDWFTYTPGETAHYFAYYAKDHALIGFDPSYGSEDYTDNHFHYGYFTSSAGVLALLDPAWAAQYGAMAELVAKQYANWDRSDTRFPFLRTFDPWSGHSFAGGSGDVRGNNQESTSEAIQSWQGLVLLGESLGDSSMVAAGMMGYTEESKAEQLYWFGTPSNPLPAGYARSNVAINYTDSKSYATFFGANPEYILGIETLPLWPSLSFLGQYPTVAANAVSLMFQQRVAANSANGTYASFESGGENDWLNVILGYVSMYDPQTAATEYARMWAQQTPTGTTGNTGIYYYQTQSQRTHGVRDYTERLSMTLGGVYSNATLGSHTYIVFNPGAAQTVYVYDMNGNVIDSFVAKADGTTTVVRGTVVEALVLSPGISTMVSGASQQFSATAVDQANDPLPVQPTVTWSLASGSLGSISATGIYSSPANTIGSATIVATTGNISQSLTLTFAPLPNYVAGFVAGDQSLSFNNGASVNGTKLQITDGTTVEARSVFTKMQLDVTHFVTAFTFTVGAGTTGNNLADGFTFAIQNQAPTAYGGNGGNLGFVGISKALALKFHFYSENATGLLYTQTSGNYSDSEDLTSAGIALTSGHPYSAIVSYDGTNLTLILTDTTDPTKVFTNTWQVNIPTIVGGNAAYVGFTGGTGGFTATQSILNWTWDQPVLQLTPAVSSITSGKSAQFGATLINALGVHLVNPSGIIWSLDSGSVGTISSTGLYTAPLTASGTAIIRATLGTTTNALTASVGPDPDYYGLFTAGGLTLNGGANVTAAGRLRITDPSATETRSAFYNNKVDITHFVTDFSFQITGGNTGTNWAEGFTFTLQNQGLTAVGAGAGGLAYQNIANSLAIKFDLWDTSGEGTNSVGLYTGGAAPTNIGSISLPTTTIDLRSTHIYNVALSYDGTNLTFTITDSTNTAKTYTNSWAVNIPALMGENTAWAGFTGATGGYSATQEIINWTWNKPQADLAAIVPAPRTTAVTTTGLTFNRPISNLNYADFTLTRDGGANLLTSATTVTTSDNLTFTLGGNLAALTALPGTYVLSLTTAGYADLWNNTLASALSTSWVMNAINANAGDTIALARNTTTGLLDVSVTSSAHVVTNYSVNTTPFTSLILNGASAASFALNSTLDAVNLVIQNNATATVPGGASRKLIRMAGLTLATGGTLDLNNNDMVVANTAVGSLYAAIVAGTLKSSNANSSGGLTALGSLDGATFLAIHPAGTLFDSVTVASTDALVRYTYRGDATLDGKVTVGDMTALDYGFLFHLTPSWYHGDFNNDGVVDYRDAAALQYGLANQGGVLAGATPAWSVDSGAPLTKFAVGPYPVAFWVAPVSPATANLAAASAPGTSGDASTGLTVHSAAALLAVPGSSFLANGAVGGAVDTSGSNATDAVDQAQSFSVQVSTIPSVSRVPKGLS